MLGETQKDFDLSDGFDGPLCPVLYCFSLVGGGTTPPPQQNMATKFYCSFEHVAFTPLDKKLVLSKKFKALANSFIVCLQGFLRTSLLFCPGHAVFNVNI